VRQRTDFHELTRSLDHSHVGRQYHDGAAQVGRRLLRSARPVYGFHRAGTPEGLHDTLSPYEARGHRNRCDAVSRSCCAMAQTSIVRHGNPRRKIVATICVGDAETFKVSPRLPSGLLNDASRSSMTARHSNSCSSSTRALLAADSVKIFVERKRQEKTVCARGVNIEKPATHVSVISFSGRPFPRPWHPEISRSPNGCWDAIENRKIGRELTGAIFPASSAF